MFTDCFVEHALCQLQGFRRRFGAVVRAIGTANLILVIAGLTIFAGRFTSIQGIDLRGFILLYLGAIIGALRGEYSNQARAYYAANEN